MPERLPPLFRRAVALGTLGAVGAFGVAACSGGSSKQSRAKQSTTTAKPQSKAVTVTLGGVKVVSAGPQDATLPDDVRDQIVGSVQKYVDAATVEPLQTGGAAGDVSPLFSTAALAKLNANDKPTMFDEGYTKAERIEGKTASVSITALADPAGKPVIASADVLFDITATVGGKPLEIKRLGQLVFEPSDGWKITGYDIGVTRSGAGLPAETSTTAATGTSAP